MISYRVQTALMTVIKFGWIQFICIYFLLWWASEHFLRWVLEEPTASEWGGVFLEEPHGFVV